VNILVTGAGGQVGRELQRVSWPGSVNLIMRSHTELNITDCNQIARQIVAPLDMVINLAAYTAVDRAENDRAAATAANVEGPALLAERCVALRIPLIHLSTDYVFGGTKNSPYLEDDAAQPLNHYGISKWRGEQAVRAHLGEHIIIRTASVFGEFGHNFVKAMLRLGTERKSVEVVSDQSSCPTPAPDIALVIARLSRQVVNGACAKIWGTYHFCGWPPVSWFDFAHKIFEFAVAQGVAAPELYPISADEYPGAATRPANSVLDCGKIQRILGIEAPSWAERLPAVVSAILKRGASP